MYIFGSCYSDTGVWGLWAEKVRQLTNLRNADDFVTSANTLLTAECVCVCEGTRGKIKDKERLLGCNTTLWKRNPKNKDLFHCYSSNHLNHSLACLYCSTSAQFEQKHEKHIAQPNRTETAGQRSWSLIAPCWECAWWLLQFWAKIVPVFNQSYLNTQQG